eukprot:10855222-Prorocentrum_lima.AAC.1
MPVQRVPRYVLLLVHIRDLVGAHVDTHSRWPVLVVGAQLGHHPHRVHASVLGKRVRNDLERLS